MLPSSSGWLLTCCHKVQLASDTTTGLFVGRAHLNTDRLSFKEKESVGSLHYCPLPHLGFALGFSTVIFCILLSPILKVIFFFFFPTISHHLTVAVNFLPKLNC